MDRLKVYAGRLRKSRRFQHDKAPKENRAAPHPRRKFDQVSPRCGHKWLSTAHHVHNFPCEVPMLERERFRGESYHALHHQYLKWSAAH